MSQLDEFKNGKTSASGSSSVDLDIVTIVEYSEKVVQVTSYTEDIDKEVKNKDFRSLRNRMRNAKFHGEELFLDDPTE